MIARGYDFSKLTRYQERGYVVFLESKALTPCLLKSGFRPDYLFMPFPETTKGNALHFFIFRSFLAGKETRNFFQPAFHPIYDHMRNHFEKYFSKFRPQKGLHKRYAWNNDVFLKDSAFDLLQSHPKIPLITNREGLKRQFPSFSLPNECYMFSTDDDQFARTIDEYYTPIEKPDGVYFRSNNYLNSMAISFYPLIYYMGAKNVIFLGMDMSMLGTMEYSAPFVFKSMSHFYCYLLMTRKAFNANYVFNFPIYLRPKSEFSDTLQLWQFSDMNFLRVNDPYRYFAKFKRLGHIHFPDFDELIESQATLVDGQYQKHEQQVTN